MGLSDSLQRINAYQQRHTALAIPLAVIKKFSNDSAGNLAALVAYYAFFSIFPLILVLVTVLGFVLQGHPGELHSVERSVARNFPGLSTLLHFSTLKGSVIAVVIGTATSLWSGLGITNTIQTAFNTVWAVPMKDRPNFVSSRLRGLMMLVSIGVLFIVATAASGLVAGGLGGPAATVLGILVSLLVNVVLFFVAFRFSTSRDVQTRCLWVGIVLSAIIWTVLQSVGGLYVHHVLGSLSSAYESFATVIALIIWLHLGSQLTLYAAEVNVVISRHLWPRSLFGPPVAPADRETYQALAKTEERHRSQTIEVSFEEPGDGAQSVATASEATSPAQGGQIVNRDLSG
jgi:membrane protein